MAFEQWCSRRSVAISVDHRNLRLYLALSNRLNIQQKHLLNRHLSALRGFTNGCSEKKTDCTDPALAFGSLER